jgi:Zn-finger nucleic acid-binding protein
MTYCRQCLEKERKIAELQEDIVSLKAKLRYQERTAKEGFFGSSTPSSKLPVKPNSAAEHQRNQGGGRVPTCRDKGHGRAGICELDADKVERIVVSDTCPDCGGVLVDKGFRSRAVMDCQPVKVKKVAYQLQRKYCPKCRTLISARPPGVGAKCLYSNRLLKYVAVQHYIYGNTPDKSGLKGRQASATPARRGLTRCTICRTGSKASQTGLYSNIVVPL